MGGGGGGPMSGGGGGPMGGGGGGPMSGGGGGPMGGGGGGSMGQAMPAQCCMDMGEGAPRNGEPRFCGVPAPCDPSLVCGSCCDGGMSYGCGGCGCGGGGGGGGSWQGDWQGGGRGGNCCDSGMGSSCAGGGCCYGSGGGGGSGCYAGGGGGCYGSGSGSACGSCGGCSGCGRGYAGGGGCGGGGSWQGDWQGTCEPESYHEGFHESFHDDRPPHGHMQPAPEPQQWSPSAQAAGDSGGPRASSEHEELYNQWKQAIVAFAKPVLRGPFERSEITKDEFKQILKKTADKVIGSYRKEGVPPPANFEIVGNQRAKIQKLVEDYVSFIQKRDE
jgi:hypothetical protein